MKTIDLEKLKTPFPENEIEWRLAQCGKKGNGQIWAMCLAYVSARSIMNRLDEVCGAENWKVSYNHTTRGVICDLSIKIGPEWVTKQDGAEETEIESFKGGISSALKRAGSVWGIGRYLYGLDQGFARIVDGGSLYGKTKDGTEFKWEPPKLPEWAIPEGHTCLKLPDVKPGQPEAGDGIQEGLPYRITFGKFKGRGLHEVQLDELRQYISYIEGKAKKEGKSISEEVMDFITRAEDHIGSMENSG